MQQPSILIDYLARIFAPFTNLITNSINRYASNAKGDIDGDGEITEADILWVVETTLKKVLPDHYIDHVSFKSFKAS